MRYQINPAVRLFWHACGTDYLIFDETSGQTHQLDPVRAFVLTELQVAPKKFEDILGNLITVFESDAPEVLSHLIVNVLNEFKSFGLVEAVTQ